MTPDHFAGAALFKWVFAQIICLRLCFDSVCVTQCVCVYMVCVGIPRTQEPGGLRSMGCRVGHDCTTNTHIYCDTIRNTRLWSLSLVPGTELL